MCDSCFVGVPASRLDAVPMELAEFTWMGFHAFFKRCLPQSAVGRGDLVFRTCPGHASQFRHTPAQAKTFKRRISAGRFGIRFSGTGDRIRVVDAIVVVRSATKRIVF